MAQVITKTDPTAGCGGVLLGAIVAVLLGFLLGPLGMVAGALLVGVIMLASIGKGRSYRCGACKNAVAGRDVTICPTCREPLS